MHSAEFLSRLDPPAPVNLPGSKVLLMQDVELIGGQGGGYGEGGGDGGGGAPGGQNASVDGSVAVAFGRVSPSSHMRSRSPRQDRIKPCRLRQLRHRHLRMVEQRGELECSVASSSACAN